jgi:hypothetical protein
MKQLNRLKLVGIILSTLLLQNCKTKNKSWEIEVKGIENEQVYLCQVNVIDGDTVLDSARVEKGKSSFRGTNPNKRLQPYKILSHGKQDIAFDVLIANGEHLKVAVKDEFDINFSGTTIAKTYNKFLDFRKNEMDNLKEFRKVLSDSSLTEDQINSKMLIYKEKTQEIENEKIEFLKTIQNPELNSFLVLHEAVSSGVIEKEVFGKYVNALTPEGSMTKNGHKMHQIYEVFDAYALSRELDLLDSATIRMRYNKLDGENKSSEFAGQVLEKLEGSGN